MTGASAKNRNDFLPEFEPQPDRCRLVEFLVDPIVSRELVGRRLQMRRQRPGQRAEHDGGDEQQHVGPPFQMRHREHGEHHRQRDQRSA